MRKYTRFIAVFALLFVCILSGCSSNGKSDSSSNESADFSETKQDASMEIADKTAEDGSGENRGSEGAEDSDSSPATADATSNRMVVYTADLYLTVKNAASFENQLEQQVLKEKGYIVSKNSYEMEEENLLEGTIVFRIPQASFRPFLEFLGDTKNIKIERQDIAGTDVTEEYVDLSSRLKAKEAVEKRLYDFMEKAQKTEDLLKISTDLGNVQSEIEQIKGRMNYLENQSSLSTVTLNYTEKNYGSAGVKTEDLETWGKIKEAFADSLNGLVSVGSSLLVFFVGYLPVWLVFFAIAGIVWGGIKIYRGRRNNKKE